MEIKIDHVSKSYGSQQVLRDLTLQIRGVQVIGIIGESGCGKSTLLQQLIGIETPDTGTIEVNTMTVSPANLKNYQRKIGVVFQQHNLFPHCTIEENIALILTKMKKMDTKAAKQRTAALLSDFHLTSQAKSLPSHVSGGQAQRASIVRAIATNPELLFLDEPTAALDPVLTREVLEAIQNLKKGGSEFIFVTHEMDFLQQFADYFIFIDQGKVIEMGKIELLQQPKTALLKEFIRR